MNTGIMLAQQLTSALIGMGIDYHKLAKVVYGEHLEICKNQRNGDWLEFPNGDTYIKTFTVNKHLENGEKPDDQPMTCADVQSLGLDEGDTCALPCLHCTYKVYFIGNLDKVPLLFVCPHCNKLTFNKFEHRFSK